MIMQSFISFTISAYLIASSIVRLMESSKYRTINIFIIIIATLTVIFNAVGIIGGKL